MASSSIFVVLMAIAVIAVLASLLVSLIMTNHHHHHHHVPAASASLGITAILINVGAKIMQVNLTWTTPSLRADGTTALTLAEILTTNVRRNGTIIGSPTAAVGAMTFVDSTPLTGSDAYTVETVTTDGLVSKLSNLVTIVVPNANPAAAVTDLAGTLA